MFQSLRVLLALVLLYRPAGAAQGHGGAHSHAPTTRCGNTHVSVNCGTACQ